MIRIVNVVPAANAAETAQDSEPNIAVNPANPNEIVVTAFTPDPLGSANAPIYRTTDGGRTWALEAIVPSVAGASTGDIMLRFGGAMGTGWLLGAGDRYVLLRDAVDGDALVVVSGNGRWIGVLREDNGVLRAKGIGHEWVNPPGGTGASGWHLNAGDNFFSADLDGDGRDELVVVSANGQWMGVLRQSGTGLEAGWIGNDWVNHPGGSGANGWDLKQGDRFVVADIDGDGRDELVVISPNGQWIGLLRDAAGSLQADWIGHDWVNHPGGSGANGWNLNLGDKFFVADIDGDCRDEIVVVSSNGEWIGILSESGGELRAGWIGHDWVNHPGGSGANGWNLNSGDSFYAADIDGDNRDELIVVSANGEWMGVLFENGGALSAGWIGHDWVNHPGGSGASGWNLRRGDRFIVADVDGDNRDELVVVSPDGLWVGELREDNGALTAGWIRKDWINHQGGSGANGWALRLGDRLIAGDFDDDGSRELVFVSPNGLWVGMVSAVSGTPITGWIGHLWIEPPGGSNAMLFGGILAAGANLRFETLRSFALGTGTQMELLQRRNPADQPYVEAYGDRGVDRVYVGVNDFNAPNRQTATIDVYLDARARNPSFSSVRIERRTTGGGQDGPPVRAAVHAAGTVYAAFHRWTAFNTTTQAVTADIVVVRDDDWGRGNAPFEALVDSGDNVVGQRVATGVNYVFGAIVGQERIGSCVSIAVDPTSSATVYLAWGDLQNNMFTLHVRRSTDSGQTWSGDLLSIAATNPALAVNDAGVVGFLCQQLTGTAPNQRWETHWRRSDTGGATWTDTLLCDTPANAPVRAFLPYLGDYIGLQAVGSVFYGAFSANNTPNNNNFPRGVTYQRPANFMNQTLDDGAGNVVAASIDPFFVKITEAPNDAQARVRCIVRSDHRRAYRRITHIGGLDADNTRWKLAVHEAIERIEVEGQRFFVEEAGQRADVIVATTPAGRRYLKTVADGDAPNNLLSLPDCP